MNMTTTMSEPRFEPGSVVRVDHRDPPHHNRVPRYIRGVRGVVAFYEGSWRLADNVAQGVPSEPEPVYCVEFTARDLFGAGDHTVRVDIWESWLAEE